MSILIANLYSIRWNELEEWHRSGQPWDQCDLGQYITFNTLEGLWHQLKIPLRPRQGEDSTCPTAMHSRWPQAWPQRNTRPTLKWLCQANWAFNEAALEMPMSGDSLNLSFWRSTLRHLSHLAWTTGGSHVQPGPTSKRVCQTEIVDSSELSTIPPAQHPRYHPSAGYLHAYGYRPEQT